MALPGETVEPFNADTINPILSGLEQVLIDGDGTEVIGIIDNMITMFTTGPAHPLGSVAAVRFDADDLTALAGDLTNLPDGIVFTTEDPSLFGFDPSVDFMTLLVGEADAPGLLGLASDVDLANLDKAGEAITFTQNFINATASTNLNTVLNEFSTAISVVTAHEAGHLLGLNHTERVTLPDDPNNDGDSSDAAESGLVNLIASGRANDPEDLFNLTVLGPSSIRSELEFTQIGNSADPLESEAVIDSLWLLLNWIM